MILKTLYLQIEGRELPTEYTYDFLKSSRHICNYIEREVLRKIRFKADGFSQICISLCSDPKTEFFVNSANVACCDLKFDRERYDALSKEELPDFYIELLEAGLRQMTGFCPLPLDEILQGLNDFKSGGFVNEWTHKRRVFKKHALTAALRCELSQSAFKLRLEVLKDKAVTFNEVILETDPDEVAFEHRYKDVMIDDESLVVTSKYGDPLFAKNIGELARPLHEII